MKLKLFVAAALALFVAVGAFGQAPAGYLDVFITKVKPEKRAEFDAVNKKIADANRRQKGDTWVALETIYGEWNTVYFVSDRKNYAEAGQGFEAFFGALTKAFGPAGAAKVWQDVNNCLISSRGEIRQRRPDLSRNVPADPGARRKLVGESRFTRTVVVRVRPGRLGDYLAQLRVIKEAFDKTGSQTPVSVSQSATGQQGTVFYITTLSSSLAGFDPTGPSFQQVLGEEAFQKYVKTIQESVLTTESYINRYLPELSNPPEEVVSAAPDFWKPKPAPAAKPKPMGEEAKKEAAKKKG